MTDFVVTGLKIPWSLVSSELEGLYGSLLLAEFKEIIGYYNVYEKGADFTQEKNKDFTPSDLRFKESQKLIDREARFLFSKHPDFWVSVPYDKESEDETTKQEAQAQTALLQSYIDNVFEATGLYSKLVKAAKDCFIGKRVAYFVNFDEVNRKIMVDFVPSLEFVFDTDPADTSKITKITTFYTTRDSQNKAEQRVYKKKYWLNENDVCWINESLYNGLGELVEEITPDRATKFVGVIPAGVIINDGLTGDLDGSSDVAKLQESESYFSRISNGDIDSERCGMNPIRYAVDMNPSTTQGLSIAPGAFWDLASDPNAPDGVTGSVGMMETSLSYTSAVNSTLSRIRSAMYETLDVPDTSADALKGVVSSGKTLKAIYWPLIVRCDEKMLAWRPALKNIVDLLIEGAKLYPASASSYTSEAVPDVTYEVKVDNQYPLPDDEADEKETDLAEVNAQTMSKMAYMKKWRNLTDTEAMQELKQIALEREMLEDSYGNGGMPSYGEEDDLEGMEEEDDLEGDELEDEELDSDRTFDSALAELEGLLDGL
jgi:hypothetical protein